ncbi:Ppx/GppA family phosphatase [Rhodospirillaceae bacterium KN72]|uniref:Ppx/GppA family phosphatase n=1 Tax=Pacificispira spongiicola TaxID=2729598 RepID=A0A7Y0E2R2_9PROT|nr:Ppx/GppA family phosphatase [Pacificispira spongiicola]NMM46123.1 Ppx/GppA family phosphatase [Pacificispira spongiicola]
MPELRIDYSPKPSAAVVDIGSNSIRLVVYESADRAPVPLFNEKLLCGLGRGLDATGRLHEEGVEMALKALPRFMRVAREMGVASIDILATAAARDAENGAEFIRRAGQLCGQEIRVLTGEEEARLSGLGVVSSTPGADGMMGDLGGGSVELVELDHGQTGRQATLPLGPLRLDPKLVAKPTKAVETLDAALAGVDWIDSMKGRHFHLVGGAWRNLARMHMDHTGYPLHIIHNYRIPTAKALELIDLVAHQSPTALQRVPGISKRRVETLPYAAMLLHRILIKGQPKEVVFCANGLREGCLFDKLSADEKAIDPLLSGCVRHADHEKPDSAVTGDDLFDWMSGLFDGEELPQRRLRKAACILSDIARREHPDYRAEHALMRVLRLPVTGIEHKERAFLALAVSSRHAQVSDDHAGMRAVRSLIDDKDMDKARAIGLAIRFAYTLTGGVSPILDRMTLRRDGAKLLLNIPPDLAFLIGDAVERRFAHLGKVLSATPEFVTGSD